MEQAELKQGIATILAEQISAKEQATLLTNAGLTIVEAARMEGVAPLLYWKLKTDFKHVMLEEVWRGFECEFYSSLAYNQLQFGELKRVLPKLESHGIEVILLKGAALAHTLYPDPALRPMNDLDLLVHPEDLFKTIKLIKRLGYEQEKITHHAVLRGGQERRVAIEVHWCLPPNNISRNNQALLLFWGESKPHPVYKNANIFSPNHQLLYLAAHLLGSGGEGRLVHWYDIFEIIRVEEKNINWQEVINVSEMLNWGSLIYDLAHGLNKKFKLSIGHNQEFISSHNQNRYVINYSEYIQQAFGLIRLSDKLKLLFGFIFPSSKYLLWKYHSKNVLSVPILFIRRLMGLFKKY